MFVQTAPMTKYLQVFSLGEPKLKITCVRDDLARTYLLERNPFSGMHDPHHLQ